MTLTRLMKPALPVLAGLLVFTTAPLYGADKKEDTKEEKKADDSGGVTISQFNFGTSIANGEITQEAVKGKVVVIEQWGIH